MLPALSIEMRYRDAGSNDIAMAREWLRDYDGPNFVRCDPESGSFTGSIGLNISSDKGSRGITITVESYRESDAVLGLYLIATGQP